MSTPTNNTYIYLFYPVHPDLTNPAAWDEPLQAIYDRHYAHLATATAAGTVLLAGRSLDEAGPAMVIFEAASEEEAREFMMQDAFVAEGVVRATLHPFRVSLLRE